jgi:hypothetical protein
VSKNLAEVLKTDDVFLDKCLEEMPLEAMIKFPTPTINILNPFPKINKPASLKLASADLLRGAPTCFKAHLSAQMKDLQLAKFLVPFLNKIEKPQGSKLGNVRETLRMNAEQSTCLTPHSNTHKTHTVNS